jgi:hypothetical protein
LAYDAIVEFRIVVHADVRPRIVEVIYPPTVTVSGVEDYVRRIKATMDQQKTEWVCLVDQRDLTVMPPELVEKIAFLNAYAQKRRMKKTARVVSSAVATLQAARISRDSLRTETPLRTFTSRDEALAWLTSSATS